MKNRRSAARRRGFALVEAVIALAAIAIVSAAAIGITSGSIRAYSNSIARLKTRVAAKNAMTAFQYARDLDRFESALTLTGEDFVRTDRTVQGEFLRYEETMLPLLAVKAALAPVDEKDDEEPSAETVRTLSLLGREDEVLFSIDCTETEYEAAVTALNESTCHHFEEGRYTFTGLHKQLSSVIATAEGRTVEFLSPDGFVILRYTADTDERFLAILRRLGAEGFADGENTYTYDVPYLVAAYRTGEGPYTIVSRGEVTRSDTLDGDFGANLLADPADHGGSDDCGALTITYSCEEGTICRGAALVALDNEARCASERWLSCVWKGEDWEMSWSDVAASLPAAAWDAATAWAEDWYSALWGIPTEDDGSVETPEAEPEAIDPAKWTELYVATRTMRVTASCAELTLRCGETVTELPDAAAFSAAQEWLNRCGTLYCEGSFSFGLCRDLSAVHLEKNDGETMLRFVDAGGRTLYALPLSAEEKEVVDRQFRTTKIGDRPALRYDSDNDARTAYACDAAAGMLIVTVYTDPADDGEAAYRLTVSCGDTPLMSLPLDQTARDAAVARCTADPTEGAQGESRRYTCTIGEFTIKIEVQYPTDTREGATFTAKVINESDILYRLNY